LPVTVIWGSRPMQGGPVRSKAQIVQGEPFAQWTFDVPQTGQIVFAASVLDGASLQPLVLSSEMIRMAEAARATLKIATEGDWQARLGDVVVAAGSGDAEQVTVPLSKGVNVVSITFASGSGAFAGEFQSVPLASDGTWVMAGAELPAAFYSPEFDDTELPRAQVLGESELPGAQLIGAEAGPVTVRKTLLWNHSRLWPKPGPYVHIAQNCPQHLTFPRLGVAGWQLDDFRFKFAVPAGFEVLGASSYYGAHPWSPEQYSAAQAGTVMLNDEQYSVWEVTADMPVGHRTGYSIVSTMDVYVRTGQAPAEGATPQIAYWLEAEHGAVIEAPQFVPVKILPPLRGKQPRHIRWQLWGSYLFRVDDLDMRAMEMEAMKQAGINEVASGEQAELCNRYGMHRTAVVNGWPSASAQAYLQAHPEHRLVTAGLQPSESYVCPSVWLNEGGQAYEQALREVLERLHPHGMEWDIETGPFDGYFACYCPRCLAEFAKFAQVDVAQLTPQTIQDRYADQWIDFIVRRSAQLCLKTKEAIHRIVPDTTFMVYCGYHSPYNRNHYSLDWQYIGELEAVDLAMCGYGRSASDVAATREVLGDIPLATGAILRPYALSDDRVVSPYTKARLLRRLTDGTGGLLLYDRLPLEGQSYWALAEITRLCADYEDIFMNRELLQRWGELGEANLPDSAVLEYEGKHLVAIMNEGGKSRTYQFHLPETGFTEGIEYYSGQAVRPGQQVELELEAGAAAVYVLE